MKLGFVSQVHSKKTNFDFLNIGNIESFGSWQHCLNKLKECWISLMKNQYMNWADAIRAARLGTTVLGGIKAIFTDVPTQNRDFFLDSKSKCRGK